jgi:phosphoribulokinase
MARSIVVGIVGDSGAGKTTVTRGLVRALGDEHVTRVSADDYHRYDRAQRRELGVTPLHPDANHLDILTQHLLHLRRGEPVLKPVYSHRTGTFEPPVYIRPARFLVVEGLLDYHTETLRTLHDVRVMLTPPEELRRAWKLKRDCTRRGYTTDEVLAELDRRQSDAETFVAPQREAADIVVAFRRTSADPAHLDADLILRDTLPHPDLSPLLEDGSVPSGRSAPARVFAGDERSARTRPSRVLAGDERSARTRPSRVLAARREHEWLLRIPGDLDPAHAAELEEAVWDRMSFASHLRIRRLGEFTVGTDLRRSDSLALVQLLILYHAVTARAALATGGSPPRAEPRRPTGADSALHT